MFPRSCLYRKCFIPFSWFWNFFTRQFSKLNFFLTPESFLTHFFKIENLLQHIVFCIFFHIYNFPQRYFFSLFFRIQKFPLMCAFSFYFSELEYFFATFFYIIFLLNFPPTPIFYSIFPNLKIYYTI